MAVDRPDMHNPQVDEPSLLQPAHDSEDESLVGLQNASTEGPQSWDVKGFSSHSYQYGPKSLIEAVLQPDYFNSDYEEIKAILENEKVEVDEKGAEGRTALSYAIEKWNCRVVELFLEKGADPNSREDQNSTPFFWAARRGPSNFRYNVYNDMIVSLLRAGADPNLTDDQGNTPLAEAAANGNHEFVKLVAKSDGSKFNTHRNEEKTPLMRAAAGGWPKCLSYLLSPDAVLGSCTWWERFLQTRSGQRKKEPRPFQWQKAGPEALEDLPFRLRNCSLWNEVLPNGRTFLSWAVEYEDGEIVKLLLDLEADPDIRDTAEHQMTPLIKALRIGNMAMVDLLKRKDRYSMHILVDEADDRVKSKPWSSLASF